MTLLGVCIIAVCAANLGFVLGAWWAGREKDDLEQALKCKRDVWCGGCQFKADSKGFDDQLAAERKSKYDALRHKEKEIQALKVKLYEATRQSGATNLTRQVARG